MMMLLYCLVFIIIYSRCIGSKDKLDSEVVTFYFLVCFQPLTSQVYFLLFSIFLQPGLRYGRYQKFPAERIFPRDPTYVPVRTFSPGPN